VGEGGELNFLLEHGMHEGLEGGLGLLLRDAGLQAAEGVHPAVAALLEHVFRIADIYLRHHHDRNENFRGKTQLNTVKTFLRNADDGHFVIVDGQSFADDLGIAGEPRFPKAIVEYGVRVALGTTSSAGVRSRPMAGTIPSAEK